MAPSAPARPPERYGDHGGRRRPGTVVAAVVLAAGFGAWVLWAALSAANPDVRSELRSFHVASARRVVASIAVTADAAEPVSCTVQAEDRDRVPVGEVRATLPADAEATRVTTVVVRTTHRAVTAVIVGCRLVTSDR